MDGLSNTGPLNARSYFLSGLHKQLNTFWLVDFWESNTVQYFLQDGNFERYHVANIAVVREGSLCDSL